MQPAPSHRSPAKIKPSLDNCEAVIIQVTLPDALTFVVVWRDRPRHVRPLKRGKRIRDLRPGGSGDVSRDNVRRASAERLSLQVVAAPSIVAVN